MKKHLFNNKGGGYITACVITIVIAMILSSVFFYAACITIIQNTREMTEEVMESFIIENAVLIYDSIKQGHDLTEKLNKNVQREQEGADGTEEHVLLGGGDGFVWMIHDVFLSVVNYGTSIAQTGNDVNRELRIYTVLSSLSPEPGRDLYKFS